VEDIGDQEKWEIIPADGGKVYLKSSEGTYIKTDFEGGGRVGLNCFIGPREKWLFVDKGDNKYGIQSMVTQVITYFVLFTLARNIFEARVVLMEL
jgi:hypothetical protein